MFLRISPEKKVLILSAACCGWGLFSNCKLFFLHSKLQTSISVTEHMYSPYFPHIAQTGSPGEQFLCIELSSLTESIVSNYKLMI